jgi:glycosyltransferase involved in cell wall biosynthesis
MVRSWVATLGKPNASRYKLSNRRDIFMSHPISLIMTLYNREAFLDKAITSLLQQTYPDFELLLWDDGSIDNSLNIAHHYAQQDSRIRVITARNQGFTLALKSAIAQTIHPYLAWIDSDDFLAPTALEETVAILNNHSNVGMVYTNHLVVDANNQVQGLGQRCQIPYSKTQLLVDFMTFHFRLMRRSLYNQVGGINAQFTYAQDYDLCLKFSEITDIYHLERSLYYYRNHPQSISQEKRVEQISAAQQAINDAIVRRGLSDRYELEVQIIGQFALRQKQVDTAK